MTIRREFLDPMDPALEISPVSHDFARTMIGWGHFTFVADGDPMGSTWRMTGMARCHVAITSAAKAGTVIYACQDGAAWKIEASQVETLASARIEYVRALDLRSFGNQVGIEQWGVIQLGKDAEELLADWPGAIAKQIVVSWAEAKSLSVEAKRHIGEWYEWADETLLVQRGYVK